MALLGVLVMAIGGAAVWYWRLKMMREAGSEIIDTVERMRGAYKRRDFRKKAAAAPLASITHPGIAAICFFWSLANQRPVQRDGEKRVIEARMRPVMAGENIDEIINFADWAIRQVVAPADLVGRFRKLWLASLDMEERRELIDIAEQVCAVQGEPTTEQQIALDTLRRTLLS